MSWLKRTMKPVDEESLLQSEYEGVLHGRWLKKDHQVKRGLFVYDMFVNPDQSSPIAGILFERYGQRYDNNKDYRTMEIKVIERASHTCDMKTLLDETGLEERMRQFNNRPMLDKIEQMGVAANTDISTVVGEMSGYDIMRPEGRAYYAEHMGHFMEILRDTAFISANPEIRASFAHVIQQQLAASMSQEINQPHKLRGH